MIKVFDIRQRQNVEQYLNELETMLKIQESHLEGLSDLVDHGKTNPLLSQGMFKKGEKFIIMKILGTSLHSIFVENHKNFKKIDVLKVGI